MPTGVYQRTKITKEKMSKSHMGIRNGMWKGSDAKYLAIHAWIRTHKGKLKVCKFCGSNKNLEWANKDHTYKRKLEDYISLCRSCHMKYDIKKGRRVIKGNK